MLISLSLLVLGILTVFSTVGGSAWFSVLSDHAIDSSLIINGSVSDIELSSYQYAINISPITGALVGLTGMVALAVIIGIRILGTGLSEETVRIISYATVYMAIWTMLSLLSWSMISAIEVFGGIFWITLTIMYLIGIVQQITRGGA